MNINIKNRTWCAAVIAFDRVIEVAIDPGFKASMIEARRDLFDAATVELEIFDTADLPDSLPI